MTQDSRRARDLSKLEKAELIELLLELEARDEVNRRLATIFETSVDAIIGSTPDAIITDWNQAAEALYGYSSQEAIGKSTSIIVPPELWEETRPQILKIANEESPEPIEVVRRRKDGTLINIALSISPIKNSKGHVIALSTINRDITDQKKAEAALLESERRYRGLVEITPVAVLVICKGVIVYANSAAIKFFGAQNTGQIIGKTTMDFAHPDSLEAIYKRRELLSQGAETLPFTEHRYVTLDGRTVIAETSAAALTWNGEPAHQIVARDITNARTAKEALVRSEEILRVITENSPSMIYLKDKESRVLKVNKAYQEIFGVTETEALGTRGDEYIDDDLMKNLIRQDGIVLDTGKPFESEFEFMDSAGETHYMHSIKFPVTDSKGEVYAIGGISTDITRSKLAERALAQSEARLNAFFDYAPVGLGVYDRELRYVKVNQALAEINGIEPEAHVGRYLGDVISSSLLTKWEEVDPPDLSSADSFVHADVSGETESMPGVLRHWIVSRFPIGSADDSLGSIGAVVFEITDRKNAEESLRASEQRLRDIVETGTDWIWETDANLRFTWISHSERESLGRPEEFYVGKTMEEVGPGQSDPIKWRRHLDDMQAHQPYRDFPIQRELSDGMRHHLLISGNPILAADGAFEGYRGTGRDITAEIEAKEQTMRTQERFLRAIDTSAEGLVLFDTEDRVVLTNRTFLENSVLPREWWAPGEHYEHIVRKMVEHGFFSDQYEDRGEGWIQEILSRFHEGGEPFDFRLANGRWRRAHFERLPDEGTIARFEDITASRQREETVRQAQKMEAVGQLTGGVAHEFNNLLMVIVGNLELSMDGPLDDKTHKFLTTAMSGAMRGAELTRQLLAFSRKQELSLETVDLNGLVQGMGEMLQRTLGETVSVETDLAETIWPIFVDAGLVEGALLNLALNAFDSMDRDGRISIHTSNISLSASDVAAYPDVDSGDFVILEVADDGAGIPPEVLDRVFEPFFTTKDVGEGTGLGLSMVHGFVEQSGGFIEIQSESDRGTKVRIYLPRAEQEARPNVAGDPKPIVKKSAGTTVLVVEDDPDVRDLVVLLLTELGCNIIEAEDGKSALAQLDEHNDIDLLFTDVVLPHGLSGPDIAREAVVRRPDLKVVFTSGYPEQEISSFDWADENPRMIRKPYRKADLVEMLSEVMGS